MSFKVYRISNILNYLGVIFSRLKFDASVYSNEAHSDNGLNQLHCNLIQSFQIIEKYTIQLSLL